MAFAQGRLSAVDSQKPYSQSGVGGDDLFETQEPRKSLLKSGIGEKLKISIKANLDWYTQRDQSGKTRGYKSNLRSDKTDVHIDYLIAKRVLARIVLRFDHYFVENGEASIAEKQTFKDLFKQFSIVAVSDNGAWLLGVKGIEVGLLKEIAFGLNRTRRHRPIYGNNSIFEDITRVNEKMGLYTSMDMDLIGNIIDDVSLTIYNSKSGLTLNQIDSVSARLVKNFFEKKLGVTASVLYQGNKELKSGSEARGAVGVAYQLAEGTEVWGEFVFMDNVAKYASSDYAATVGVANNTLLASLGADLGAEVNYIEKSKTEVVVWAKFQMTDQWRLGPEVGYTNQNSSTGISDGFYFGIQNQIITGPVYEGDPDIFDVYNSNRLHF